MADNTTTNLSFRESGLYMAPEIEGYLEKKGTGVIVRKVKTWCSLQGTTLYLKKSQGLMDTLDIGEAHQVKKTGSDPTTFEIAIKKKSHFFICPSSEECTKWVKALHNAMARKDSGQRGSNIFLTSPDDSVNGEYESQYTTIGVIESTKEKTVYNVSQEYSYPVDFKEKSEEGPDPLYSDICDVALEVIARAKTEIYEDNNSFETSKTAEIEQETYSDGYSSVQKCKQPPKANDNVRNSTTQRLNISGSQNSAVTKEISENIYNDETSTNDPCQSADEDRSLNPSQLRSSIVQDKTKPETTVGDDRGETLEPFSMLEAALNVDESPIPAFNHPLTQADREPLKQLKECLSNHPGLGEASYMASAAIDNPISSLKAYLKTLNIHS